MPGAPAPIRPTTPSLAKTSSPQAKKKRNASASPTVLLNAPGVPPKLAETWPKVKDIVPPLPLFRATDRPFDAQQPFGLEYRGGPLQVADAEDKG